MTDNTEDVQPWAWIDAAISRAPRVVLGFFLFIALLAAIAVAAGWIPLQP